MFANWIVCFVMIWHPSPRLSPVSMRRLIQYSKKFIRFNFPIDLCPVRCVHCLVNGHLFGLWKSEYIFSSYTLLVKIPSGLLPYPWITWFRIDCRYQTSIIVIINIQCGFRQTFRSKINPCTPPEINGIKPMRWPRNVWANTVGFASNCIRNRLVY